MTRPPTLRTPHLILRPMAESDIEAVVGLFADPELSRFHELDLADADQARAWIRGKLGDQGPPGTGDWVCTVDGAVVGTGMLKPSADLPGGMLECGLSLARRYWGTGLAAEAGAAILDHGLGALGAPAVFALVHEDNHPSRKLATRMGFLDVGSTVHSGIPHRVLVALPRRKSVHHIELWVPDLAEAERSWGWLLTELGWTEYQRWPRGVSWRLGATYLVVEDSPDRAGDRHDRQRPGLNHVALHAGTPARIEELVEAGPAHGWRLMFADRHPHAGGPDHYAAYLENRDGYEVELVASP